MSVGAYYRFTTKEGAGQGVVRQLLSDFTGGGTRVTRAEVFASNRSSVVHADVEALAPGDMSVFSVNVAQLSGVVDIDVFPRF